MARTAPAPNIPPLPGMNPGAFVQGGGGDGGGAGGKGGKGGDGKQGANGGKGGEGGEGGGKGAGACGQGGAGACTNCGHNVARGDPVDVVTGKVFTIPKSDLYLRGFFDLDVIRTYTSHHRDEDVGLGFGWRHSLAWRLVDDGQRVTIQTGDGRHVTVPAPAPTGTVEAGGWAIMRGPNFYAVRPGNEFVHLFARDEIDPRRYNLVRVLYRKRGHIALQYDRGRLARVIDSAGRVILFDADPKGRIASIRVPDPAGRTITFAHYAYDSEGNLVAAADADGNTTRYAYDEEHRLTRLEYPNGLVFHFAYDRAGRCTRTWGDYPGGQDPALAADLPKFLADGTTRARGIFDCHLEFLDDEYTEVVDSVRLQRFLAGPNGTIAKAIGSAGGVTTRDFDAQGRVISQTDPTGATWTWEYDQLDEIVREVDPEGHAVSIRRDGAGRPVEIVDQMGGVTEIGRDEAGEIAWVRDPAGGYFQFIMAPHGLVTGMVDSRGGRHLYEYDARGNCVAKTFPNGARSEFEWDYWGRLVREVNALGAEARWTWSDAGLLLSFTDTLGRTRWWQYDSMGNVVSEKLADGSTTRYEYGGLNWLCRVVNPDGSERRARYNREGWAQYFENERGERTEFEHNALGLISRERTFHGSEWKYGYDEMGRLAWFDDGAGKRLRTLSPSGRLLSEEGPDGGIRSYAYNPRGDIVRAKWGDVDVQWEVNPIGRVTRELLSVEGKSYVTEGTLNEAGDRLAYKTSLGLAMNVKRDRNGQVEELSGDGGRILAIARSAVGKPLRWELGNGGAVLDTYDAANRLLRREVAGPGASQSTGEPQWVGRGGPSSAGHQYDYTPVDEIQRVTSLDGSAVEYEYDVRRHLRRVHAGGGDEEFRVDAASNYFESGPDAPARVYAKGNVLVARGDTGYRYDERGYLVEKRRNVEGTTDPVVTRYEWNEWNLLDAIVLPDGARVEFKYDPFARRVAKRTIRDGQVVENHHYVWDALAVLHDVTVDASGGPRDVRTYLFEENSQVVPIGQLEGGEWLHYVHDPGGTPLQIVDGSGRLLTRFERTPFGRTRPAAGHAVSAPFRAPGQWDDAETGLHYNRFRYYDPDAGRYISPDPIGLDGDFNLYSYGPNPIGWADPMGWQHQLFVTTGPPGAQTPWAGPNAYPGGAPGQYQSGMAQTQPGTPPFLNTRANCHTEQRFALDLINANRAQGPGQNMTGQQFNLTGQYPPCPTCHAAMMRAAKETGAKVTYSWENPKGTQRGSITYDGGTGNPSSFTGEAKQLQGSYSQSAFQSQPWAAPTGTGSAQTPGQGNINRWGVQNTSQAYSDYSNLMNTGGYRP